MLITGLFTLSINGSFDANTQAEGEWTLLVAYDLLLLSFEDASFFVMLIVIDLYQSWRHCTALLFSSALFFMLILANAAENRPDVVIENG